MERSHLSADFQPLCVFSYTRCSSLVQYSTRSTLYILFFVNFFSIFVLLHNFSSFILIDFDFCVHMPIFIRTHFLFFRVSISTTRKVGIME